MHGWQRYRNRAIVLRWLARHEHIATTGADVTLGTVSVTHNNVPVENVVVSSVEIENTSQKDISNVVVHLAHSDGFEFLGGGGTLPGSQRALAFSERFQDEIERFQHLSPDAPEHSAVALYLRTHREYLLPVLNRGGRASFVHTVTGPRATSPFVALSCDHVGVRTTMEAARPMIYGVPTTQATLAGAIAGLATAFFTGLLIHQSPLAALVGFLLGGFATLIGVALVKAWRFVAHFLS